MSEKKKGRTGKSKSSKSEPGGSVSLGRGDDLQVREEGESISGDLGDGGIGTEASRVTADAEKKRSLPARMALKTAKILFLWIPVSLIALVLLVLFGINLYLTPSRVEKLIIENFNSRSNGEISMKVQSFSLFRGFEIKDLLIKNGSEFDNSPFVEINRLVLDYGLFPMLIGNIRFNEIGIYRPRIYLRERGGVWNAARLMKPGEPKEEKVKEEPKEDKGPPSTEINLPLSVEFLFKFVLDDLRVYANGTAVKSAMEGLSFGVDIWVPPFKRIPLSLEAVSILERMKIELNPREEMNVTFTSSDIEVQPPLILTWKLLYNKMEGESGKPRFESRLKLGTYRTPVRFKRTHLAPLNFMVSYDMFYEPRTDFLRLNSLGVDFAGKKLINLSGEVWDVTTKQRFDIRMLESSIALTDLYPYYRSVTGDRSMRFGGNISLYPLTVRGDVADIDVDGQVNMKGIYFRNPSIEARVPVLTLGYSVRKRGDDMRILSDLSIPRFNYTLNRARSGENGLALGVNVSAFNNFSRVTINRVALRFYNPDMRKDALSLIVDGSVALKPSTSGNVRVHDIRFRKEPLVGMLSRSMARQLSSIPLKKPLDMEINAGFNLGKEIITADVSAGVKVPDFQVNDLKLAVKILQNNPRKRLYVNRMNLSSRERNVSVDVNGVVDLREAPGRDTDVALKVKLDMPELKQVFEDWMLSGLVDLSARMKGDLKTGRATGSVKIVHLNVKNPRSKTDVADFNLNFPFDFEFEKRKGESRIAVDKRSLIDNFFFRERENFTIKYIRHKHPSREIPFEFMKDFSATMFFRNNTFEIESMKAYVMGGALYGRNILFSLSDFKTENMEYNLVLDLTNVDIGLLDNPDPKKRTRDAELSLNAQFKGRGVDIKKELTPAGYINIHKIGDKFANRLLKGLSTEQGKSKLGIAQFPVDNSMMVDGFNFNLDKGLVYTTVSFRRKFFGYAVGVEQNKIQFDRIKLQEYMRNILGGN